MSNASTPCPEDHPLMLAWNSHKQTDEYKNSKHWALAIQPMIQVGDPDADRKRYQLMPVDQREQHIEGSLWAVFCAGYNAAQAARTQREVCPSCGKHDVDRLHRAATMALPEAHYWFCNDCHRQWGVE